MRLSVICRIFEVLCVIHRELAGGRRGEGAAEGGWSHSNCIWLASIGRQLLLLAHIILKKSCKLPVSLVEQLGNCVMFLDSTRQNTGRIAHLVALGQLAQHYIIRIVFNTLNVIISVGPKNPHATVWVGLKERMYFTRERRNCRKGKSVLPECAGPAVPRSPQCPATFVHTYVISSLLEGKFVSSNGLMYVNTYTQFVYNTLVYM